MRCKKVTHILKLTRCVTVIFSNQINFKRNLLHLLYEILAVFIVLYNASFGVGSEVGLP